MKQDPPIEQQTDKESAMKKIKDIKVSNTFAAIIIIIISSVFLIPNIIGSLALYYFMERDDRYYDNLQNERQESIARLGQSIKSLNIIDDNLRRCVEKSVEKSISIQPITNGGIRSASELTGLSCDNQGIYSIEGIDGLRSLTLLSLKGNNITNVEPASKLHKLKHLYLQRNHIANINPLGELFNLQDLYLDDNKISRADGLRELLNLRNLSLANNNVSDIHRLKELPKLRTLYLHNTHVADISAMLHMASLREASLPDLNHMFCADIIEIINTAQFEVVKGSEYRAHCRGDYGKGREAIRLIAKKQAGGTLNTREESLVLEYEINKQRQAYFNKYGNSSVLGKAQ